MDQVNGFNQDDDLDGLALLVPPIVEKHEDWSLQALKDECYRYWELANRDFFGGKLGGVVITFSPQGPGNLGHYIPGVWTIGKKHMDEVNLNAVFLARDHVEKIKTIVHEAVHHWQFWKGPKGPSKTPNYHNKECCEKMAECGIVCDAKGVSYHTDEFKQWVKRNEPKPVLNPCRFDISVASIIGRIVGPGGKVTGPRVKAKSKGSKMKKWSCGCTNVRCAVDLDAKCDKCGGKFERAE